MTFHPCFQPASLTHPYTNTYEDSNIGMQTRTHARTHPLPSPPPPHTHTENKKKNETNNDKSTRVSDVMCDRNFFFFFCLFLFPPNVALDSQCRSDTTAETGQLVLTSVQSLGSLSEQILTGMRRQRKNKFTTGPQTPSTGLRQPPSSNHCHNLLRRRSRKTCQLKNSFSFGCSNGSKFSCNRQLIRLTIRHFFYNNPSCLC